MPRYRHEWKREISLSDRIALRARLEAVCRRAMSFCLGADGSKSSGRSGKAVIK